MFASWSRGWALTKTSFQVLRLDKEILVLPLLAILAMLAIWAIGVGGLASAGTAAYGPVVLLLVFALYVLTYGAAIFFQAATVEMATIRFNGGDPVLKDGLRKASSRLGRILQWAVIAATVGLIFQMLRDAAKDNFLARLLISFMDVAWSVATYLVVPILIYQDIGPIDAIKGSMRGIKSTFGDSVAGMVGTGLIFLVISIPGWLIGYLGYVSGSIPLLVVAGVYLLGVWAVQSAVQGILVAAVYKYSLEGRLPDAFAKQGVRADQLAW